MNEKMSPYIWAGLPSKVTNFETENQQNESIHNMIKEICDILKFPHFQIYHKNRAAYLADARRITVHFIHKYTKLTLNQIAKVLQMRDHSSVIYLLETCIDFYSNDKDFKNKFILVESKLTQEYILNYFNLDINNRLMYNKNGIIIRD